MTLFEQIPFLNRLDWDSIQTKISEMGRQRQIIYGSALAILALFLLLLPLQCLSDKLGEKETAYRKAAKEASELYGLVRAYADLQKKLTGMQKAQGRGDPLESLIYTQARDLGVPQNRVQLRSITVSSNDAFEEIGKEVTIREVEYDKLMLLLKRLLSQRDVLLFIKKLSIKADPYRRTIMRQVNLTITTLRTASESGAGR